MHSILKNHNRKLLDGLNRNSGGPDEMSCISRWKGECPLSGPLEDNKNGEWVYIGISAGNWKQGLYNHRHFFSKPWLRNQTTLFKYFWKDQGLTHQIKGKLVRLPSTMNSFNGRCNMFNDEKISITNFKNCRLLLNECNKLVFKCRHKSKFKLSWLEAVRLLLQIKQRYLFWMIFIRNKNIYFSNYTTGRFT